MNFWKEDEKNRFVNPYNFVSLGSGLSVRGEERKGSLTGVIDCALTARSELAILDSATKDTDKQNPDHPCYDFFMLNGIPAIPGSEIRGAIRSAYEAVTNSCMSVCNNNILSARHPYPRKPGLVHYNESLGVWELYRAKWCKTDYNTHMEKFKKLRTGSAVTFTGSGNKVYLMQGKNQGYFLLWKNLVPVKKDGKFLKVKKDVGSVFERLDKVDVPDLKRAVENFQYSMEIYRKNGMEEKYQYQLKKDSDGYTPVWYEIVDSNEVYLSPARLSRSVFNHYLEELIGPHKKCDYKAEQPELCPACDLFGMIGERSKGSRVRFTDAVLNETYDRGMLLSRQTLKELAGPKTTAVEFYTKKPDAKAKAWSYDYMTVDYRSIPNKGMGKGKIKNDTEPIRKKIKVEIRGRKFYFHDLNKNAYLSSEKTKRNATVDLIRRNSGTDPDFTFEVYFENISPEQLHELVWTLCIGENEREGLQCHKIGHGKPIGLGSVKITVKDVRIRNLSLDQDKIMYDYGQCQAWDRLLDNPFCAEDSHIKDFLKITNINTVKDKKVSYPIGRGGKSGGNQNASHQWFIGNRSLGEGATEIKWNIKHPLKHLNAQDLTLPAINKEKNK